MLGQPDLLISHRCGSAPTRTNVLVVLSTHILSLSILHSFVLLFASLKRLCICLGITDTPSRRKMLANILPTLPKSYHYVSCVCVEKTKNKGQQIKCKAPHNFPSPTAVPPLACCFFQLFVQVPSYHSAPDDN